MFVSKIVVL